MLEALRRYIGIRYPLAFSTQRSIRITCENGMNERETEREEIFKLKKKEGLPATPTTPNQSERFMS